MALGKALGDPSLELLRADPFGARRSDAGAAVRLLQPVRADRYARREEVPLAAIVLDPALPDQRELLTAVTTVLRLTLENERLSEIRDQLEADDAHFRGAQSERMIR